MRHSRPRAIRRRAIRSAIKQAGRSDFLTALVGQPVVALNGQTFVIERPAKLNRYCLVRISGKLRRAFVRESLDGKLTAIMGSASMEWEQPVRKFNVIAGIL